MRKKKILNIVHCYSPSIGGTQWFVQNISEGLVKNNNYDITIFTTNLLKAPHRNNNKIIKNKFEIINGVTIRRFSIIPLHYFFKIINKIMYRLFNIKNKLNPYLSLLNNGPISFKMIWSIIKGDYDIIFTSSINYTALLLGLMPNRYRKNKKFILHGAAHIDDYPNKELPLTIIKLIKQWDYYLANSKYEKDYIINKGFIKKNVIEIGCGVDIKKFTIKNSILSKAYNENNKLIVGYIGRVTESKNINLLLKSIPIIKSKYKDVLFLFAGAFEPILKNHIEKYLKNDVITIDHFKEKDKPKIYNSIDIFVNPSKSESFGITFIEAWAAKKPVIGTNIGSINSLIKHNQNGFICDTDDLYDIADKILILLNDKNIRTTFGNNGYNFVNKNYSWDIITNKIKNIYDGF